MNKRFFRGIIVGMLISLALICMTVGVYLIVTNTGKSNNNSANESSSTGGHITQSLNGDGTSAGDPKELFQTKMNIISGMIDGYFLNEYDKQKMYDMMLASMMYSLGDPYSSYYTPEEFSALLETTSGKYCGIGAMVSQNVNDKKLIVVQPFENSPAFKAGMLPNDEIISVDGVNCVGEDINNVVAKMKGEKGTQVRVGVRRGEETIEMTITRDEVAVTFVTSKMLEGNVGYVAISEFFELTSQQLEEHMKKLVDQGAEKFIIDIRGNPGGLYDDVIRCLDLFIEKDKLLVYTEDKYGKREEEYAKNGVTFAAPIVIMVDEQSASASEIFAGAMQHYKKATIVGTQTFGKGIVQALYPIAVDKSGIKITVSKYYIPSGVCIHEIGITPDVKVELDEDLKSTLASMRDHDNQLDVALDVVNKR